MKIVRDKESPIGAWSNTVDREGSHPVVFDYYTSIMHFVTFKEWFLITYKSSCYIYTGKQLYDKILNQLLVNCSVLDNTLQNRFKVLSDKIKTLET